MDAYMTVFNVEISPPAIHCAKKKKETTLATELCLTQGVGVFSPMGCEDSDDRINGCVGDSVWPVVRGGAFRELQV